METLVWTQLSAQMKQFRLSNLTSELSKYLNGPKRKVLYTTHSYVFLEQEASHKSKKLSWIWIISSAKVQWIPKVTVTSQQLCYLKDKVMEVVFHLVDWDKHAMLEHILFGILSQIYFLETGIKLFIFLLYLFLIMVRHLMIRLYLGLVKEFCLESVRLC